MRYYDLTIKDRKTKELFRFAAMGKSANTSLASHVGERYNPACAQIEFDILVADGGGLGIVMPAPKSWIRIWGITLKEISQAVLMHKFPFTLKAGFKKGLPLAKPEQAGIICEGMVWDPYGNWILNELNMEFTCIIEGSDEDVFTNPSNIVFNWPKNSSLEAAIRKALEAAYKGYDIRIKIADDQLKYDSDETHSATTLADFQQYIKGVTHTHKFRNIQTLDGSEYGGVRVAMHGPIIVVEDGTKPVADESKAGATYKNPVKVLASELIGQPTWIGPHIVSFSCPLRADIGVSQFIKLPDNLRMPFILTDPKAAAGEYADAPSRQQSAFKGTYQTLSVRHVGSSRQSNAAAWATTVTAYDPHYVPPGQAKTEPAEAKEAPKAAGSGGPSPTPPVPTTAPTTHTVNTVQSPPPGLFPSTTPGGPTQF